jgi:hypothetical protein
MKPIIYNGRPISVVHLAPRETRCPCREIGRELVISVDFRNHCYTEDFDPEKHSRDQIILYDAPDRPRVFCPVRFGLSHRLPALVDGISSQKVQQTAELRNYVYVVPMQVLGRVYEVYFMLQRATAPDRADLRLTVESAYLVDMPPVLPRRPNNIRFGVLAYKTLRNERIKFAAR